jgi:GNAT superfamily N-acetyltransferase
VTELASIIAVRAARVTDAVAIGAVHVRAWQAGYRGIMPDSYLDGLSAEERAKMWAEQLAKPPSDRLLFVAERGGKIVGFAGGGPGRRPMDKGLFELYLLNVDPAHWMGGAGSQLIEVFTAWAVSQGATELVLWVVAENARARAFYERRGWAWDGSIDESDVLGAHVTECRYRKSAVRTGER